MADQLNDSAGPLTATRSDSRIDRRSGRRTRWALLPGPGLMVMLADTDAGSVTTAAQSGASWGYRLLLSQLLLIPVLYVVQEMTVRLGVVTGRGRRQLVDGGQPVTAFLSRGVQPAPENQIRRAAQWAPLGPRATGAARGRTASAWSSTAWVY